MKIAVIGAGVSGLGAALALSERHDVTLYEQDPRFGGHADTALIEMDGQEIAVDTGFIVFNNRNYPNLTALFDHLGVASEESNMTFAVSCDRGRLEYACDTLSKIFAQRWRAADPLYLRFVLEILRFMKVARRDLEEGALADRSLGDWLDAHRFSTYFRKRFLYPMGGAIWSTAAADVRDFPASSFIEFFENHELMRAFDKRIQWRTVTGGSRKYVEAILRALGPRAIASVAAQRVTRRADGRVDVGFSDGDARVFDQVVFATHSDQALAALADADEDERRVLSSVRYSQNTAVLHCDTALLPKRPLVWSSWNFLAATGQDGRAPAVSYWMNRLQNLQTPRPLVVTLNPPTPPREDLTFRTRTYAHPQFDRAAIDAQRACDAIQGRRSVWFAGAWLGWGFHEDGLTSALRVAHALGARPAWAVNIARPLRPAAAIAAE